MPKKRVPKAHYAQRVIQAESRLLPEFDELKFPFIVTSGWKSATLVNTREGSM